MKKDTLKVLQDIISDARACSQPQVPEELAKSTLASVARRIEELLAQCVKEGGSPC